MIKDTFFSWSRFMNLCRKDMVESWKSHLLRVIMMYGVMAIVLVWNGYFEYQRMEEAGVDPCWNFIQFAFMFGLFGFGLLSASFTMEKLKTKTGRLSMLMTPATSFEKYFSRWFVFTIVFLTVFFITFKLADYTRVLLYSVTYPEKKAIAPFLFSHMIDGGTADRHYSMFQNERQLFLWIACYFFLQSCFVLGSTIWPKNSFIKTVSTGVFISVVYGLIVALTIKAFIPEHFSYDPDISQRTVENIVYCIAFFFTVVNWTLAYFRFKESEIINRL